MDILLPPPPEEEEVPVVCPALRDDKVDVEDHAAATESTDARALFEGKTARLCPHPPGTKAVAAPAAERASIERTLRPLMLPLPIVASTEGMAYIKRPTRKIYRPTSIQYSNCT